MTTFFLLQGLFYQINPDQPLLSMDIRAAYPTLDRNAIIQAYGMFDPALAAHRRQTMCREQNMAVRLEGGKIERATCSTGMYQGSPLSSADYTVVSVPIMERLHDRSKQVGPSGKEDWTRGMAKAFADDRAMQTSLRNMPGLVAMSKRLFEAAQQREAPDKWVCIWPYMGETATREFIAEMRDAAQFHIPVRVFKADPRCLDFINRMIREEEGEAAPLQSSCDRGYISAGGPVGSPQFVSAFLDSKAASLCAELDALDRVECLQLRMCFLKQIVKSKLVYLFRMLPPTVIAPLTILIQARIRLSVARICGADDISDLSFEIFCMDKGMDFGFLMETSRVAFVASMIAFLRTLFGIVPQIEAMFVTAQAIWKDHSSHESFISALRESINTLDQSDKRILCPLLDEWFYHVRVIVEVSQSAEITFDSLLDMTDYPVKKLQHILYAGVVANKSVKIIEHLKKTDYPSYLIVACAGEKRESAWMCMPRDEHNWIENREFRTIVNIHIINPLPELSGALGIKCPCAMGSAGRAVISGGMPYHLFNCPIDKASIVQTHDALEQAVVDMCQMAGLQPKRDNSRFAFQGVVDSNNGRKVDIVFDGKDKWPGGGRVLLDVSVTSLVPQSVLDGQPVSTTDATEKAEHRKIMKYHPLTKRLFMKNTFIPLVIGSSGNMGLHFQKFYLRLLSLLSKESSISFASLDTFWSRRISIAVQRGFARAINQKIELLKNPLGQARDSSASHENVSSVNAVNVGGHDSSCCVSPG